MLTRIFFPILLLLFSAGCGDEITFNDSGEACLSQTAEWPEGPQVYEADRTLFAVVQASQCLSSSCTEDVEIACSIEVTGDRIVINSWGSYVDTTGPLSTCTEDCRILETSCETGVLPAGDYTVVYGGSEIPFSLPSTTGNYCLE